MKHRQKLSRYLILDLFVRNWRFLKDISTILIIAINIILILIVNTENVSEIRQNDKDAWLNDMLDVSLLNYSLTYLDYIYILNSDYCDMPRMLHGREVSYFYFKG